MTDKPIHVVHVSSAHPWTDNRIHYRECSSLSELGYQVSLIACDQDSDAPSTSVRVIKLPRLRRFKRFTLGSASAIVHALRTGAKVVHLHDPELVWSIPLLRLMRKAVIYDAHEDLPAQVMSKSYLPSWAKPPTYLVAVLIVKLASCSTHVIAATETIAKRFPKDKVTVIHNFPPLRDEEIRSVAVRDRHNSIVYIGGMGTLRGADVMVSAAAEECFPEDWTLRLAGTMRDPLRERLGLAPGWGRTEYVGQLPPQEARDLLLRSRAGVVLFQDNAAHRDALPTKMFEYFAAGLPVIASDFPLWRSIVEKYDCGTLVDETSPASVAAAVSAYAKDSQLLERHSSNARRAALDVFNWDAEVPALASVYREVLRRETET